MDSFTALGPRACTPCEIGNAHGVAMAISQPGVALNPMPFRHPDLLDNEARIRVTHSGLCHTDVSFPRNEFGFTLYPMVPGHEVIGVVEKVGEKVTNVVEGDRVGIGFYRDCCGGCSSCYPCSIGLENLCPERKMTFMPAFGGLATSFQSNASFLHKIPEALPSEGAALLCAGTTVYAGMYEYLKPGMKAGIVGIGGLGHLGIMYAKAFGCEVTAFSRGSSKQGEAREFGATNYVDTTDPEAVKAAHNTLDYVLDTGNAFHVANDMAFLRPRGHLAIAGVPSPDTDLGFNVFGIMKRTTMGMVAGASRAEKQAALEFAAAHGIMPKNEIYPFAESQAAMNSLADGVPHFPKYRNVVETESFFKTFTPAN